MATISCLYKSTLNASHIVHLEIIIVWPLMHISFVGLRMCTLCGLFASTYIYDGILIRCQEYCLRRRRPLQTGIK